MTDPQLQEYAIGIGLLMSNATSFSTGILLLDKIWKPGLYYLCAWNNKTFLHRNEHYVVIINSSEDMTVIIPVTIIEFGRYDCYQAPIISWSSNNEWLYKMWEVQFCRCMM